MTHVIHFTPEQHALLDEISIAREIYHAKYRRPNTVVLSHAQYMLLEQPTMIEDMVVSVAFLENTGFLPRCDVATAETHTTIETRSEMQVLFERDCAGVANFYKLGNGEYLSTTTHQLFNAYQRGYTAGKTAK